MSPTSSSIRRWFTAAPLLLLAACGGGGGGGGGGGVPPGPDVTPPTAVLDAPDRPTALIPGDLLHVVFRANDDAAADVRVVLDADGNAATTGDQAVLFTGKDQNGAPVALDLATNAQSVGRSSLFVIVDDGTHPAVAAGGTAILLYPARAGVSAPRRTSYGVVQGIVAFGVGEQAQGGVDLNGDMDTGDAVVDLINTADGSVVSTGRTIEAPNAVGAATARWLPPDTGFVAWHVLEADAGMSLNPDADVLDRLVAYADTTARLQPTGGATLVDAGATNRRVVEYDEVAASQDLNGDGDVLDPVVAILDQTTNSLSPVLGPQRKPGTSFRGSFDGFGAYLSDEALAGPGNLGVDLNGDLDTLDVLVCTVDVGFGAVIAVGPSNADPTAAFAMARTGMFAVYYVDEALLGAGPINGDADATDYVPMVNTGGGEFVPGTALNAGPGARYAFGDGPYLVYLAAEEGAIDRNGDGDALDTEVLHYTDAVANPILANTVAPGGFALTGLALDGGFAAHVGPGWLSLVVSETANGRDLNGDLDQSDKVFMLVDLTVNPPVVHNTGLVPLDPASLPIPGATIPITGVGGDIGVLVQAAETANGDLNGDLDTVDTLLFFYRFNAPGSRVALTDTGGIHAFVGPNQIGVTAYENLTTTDFNGDGDTLDFVLRVFSPTGNLREEGLLCDQNSVPGTEDSTVWAYLRSEAAEQRDLNGDGDMTDVVLGVWLP